MKKKYRRPNCMKALPNYEITDAMDMVQFAFKEMRKESGNSWAKHLNIWGAHKRYKDNFLWVTFYLLDSIHKERPELELKHYEFLKICLD